jgi:hypothetical protein
MTINELPDKPVWQMTGEELLFLAQHGNMGTSGETAKASTAKEKSDMYLAWLGLHVSLGAACPRLIASSRAVRSIVPLHKLGAKLLLKLN